MPINQGIQGLIDSKRTLRKEDVKNMFYYFYGRTANNAEISYWSKKTSDQLYKALEPNSKQFTNAGYYKDVIAKPTEAKPTKPVTPDKPTKPTKPSTPSAPTQPTQPSLTDKEILDLYSKYGFPKPDVNWVRKNLPTGNLSELDKVLKKQRETIIGETTPSTPSQSEKPTESGKPTEPKPTEPKTTDTTQTGPSVKRDIGAEQNFVRNWGGKEGRLPTPEEVNMAVYGTPDPQFTTTQGGTSQTGNTGNTGAKEEETTYNYDVINGDNLNDTSFTSDGNSFLVQFSSDPTPNDDIDDTKTLWLYDKKAKTYTPFVSSGALESYFGDNYAGVRPQTVKLSPNVLSSADWQGSFVPRDYGIQNDGSKPDYTPEVEEEETPTVLPGSMVTYGEPRIDSEAEQWVGNLVGTLFTSS
jgi:hypothetical protein